MIEDVAVSRGVAVLARFTEIESGRKSDRLELAKALRWAKVTGATLVTAELEPLSWNASFLLTLRGSGMRFVALAVCGGRCRRMRRPSWQT